MTRVCIIPARAGSKRLPGKNMLPYRGAPALSWPIRAALASGLFDHVIVSTEDARIAQEALRYDAAILMRPPELATDGATVVDVLKHAMRGLYCDDVCVVYATAVNVLPEDFIGSHRMLMLDVPVVVSVVPFMNCHGWHYRSNGFPCWIRRADIDEMTEFHAECAALYVVNPMRGRDIDTAEDWHALTDTPVIYTALRPA
jgi:CMP-N-acetylneuraminic acid synthetase